jgi:hypothetical protein
MMEEGSTTVSAEDFALEAHKARFPAETFYVHDGWKHYFT